jgi:hypothetical protein
MWRRKRVKTHLLGAQTGYHLGEKKGDKNLKMTKRR